jgi:CRP-like cAMP-binding protein
MENNHRRNGLTEQPRQNLILSSIPESEFQLLQPHLEYVAFEPGQQLHEPSQGIHFAYFPNCGLVSLLVGTDDGKTVEVGVLGYEGMTGAALCAGLSRTLHRAVIEVEGNGFRLAADALQNALRFAPHLQDTANRFSAIQGMQHAQTAACNRMHNVEERLARWLLIADDRVNLDVLHVTHDFLSAMLGTDRPTVSSAANRLQEHGVIEYSRGKLRIVDRKKLEELACECYRNMRQFNRDLGLKEPVRQ